MFIRRASAQEVNIRDRILAHLVEDQPLTPPDQERAEELARRELEAHRVRTERLQYLVPTMLGIKKMEGIAWGSRLRMMGGERRSESEGANEPSLHHKLINGSYDQGKLHRLMAPALAAMLTIERTYGLVQESLQKIAEKLSNQTEERIKDGDNYYPLTVVGFGGAHGTVLNAELLAKCPRLMGRSLGIDSNPKYGGQFGQLGRNAFLMNTENVTGGKNYLGPHAVLQLDDVGRAHYMDNLTFGTVLAVDNLLSGLPPLFSRQVVRVRVNPEVQDPEKPWQLKEGHDGHRDHKHLHEARYIITYEDPQTGNREEVYSDVIAMPLGIGKPYLRFDREDPNTLAVIADREEMLKQGKIPQLLTSTELSQIATDAEDAYAMLRFSGKKVAVLGAETSSYTTNETIERLTQIRTGASVVAFGSPETHWITGSKTMTSERLINDAWDRYYTLAGQLVRSENEVPKPGQIITHTGYVRQLEYVIDPETKERKIAIKSDKGETILVDYVIAATGYAVELPEILADVVDPSQPFWDQLEVVPLQAQPNPEYLDPDDDGVGPYAAYGQIKGHSILSLGPVSLKPGMKVAYRISAALAGWVPGTLQAADAIIETLKHAAPEVLDSERTEQIFYLAMRERDRRKKWSEELNIQQLIRIELYAALQEKKFSVPDKTTFSLYLREFNRPKGALVPADHNRRYHGQISAFHQDTLQRVAIPDQDAELLRQLICEPTVKEYICHALAMERTNPDIRINLTVYGGKVRFDDINEGDR